MKFRLLLFLVLVGLIAWADELTTGYYAGYSIGQTTDDHLFVRMTYDDKVLDDVVCFGEDSLQTMWLWLDDDEIYYNEAVQALTPIAYNFAGDLYNEITYNSFQVDILVPPGIELVTFEDEDGDEMRYERGDRLPNSSTVYLGKRDSTRTVDGVKYTVYLLLVYNSNGYGSHLSARTASRYKANGALTKDDAPVVALYVQNTDRELATLDDILLGCMEFGLRETYVADWDANSSKFLYGTGGNEESEIFLKYHRVHAVQHLYLTGDVNHDEVIDITDVTTLIDRVLNGTTTSGCCDTCADMNGDGDIGIDDVTMLIDNVLGE